MHLAAVAGRHDDQAVQFCSYCGRFGDNGKRVCSNCGLGVQLETEADALRSPGSSFLIVRADGIVSAASAAAERMLGNTTGRPACAVLPSSELIQAVALAAAGRPAAVTLSVAGLAVTVAACGPPAAALVVLERT
jgi:hypothetical protein